MKLIQVEPVIMLYIHSNARMQIDSINYIIIILYNIIIKVRVYNNYVLASFYNYIII